MSWFHIHTWSKWTFVDRPGYLFNMQYRICSTCQYRQEERI
jgi:hypothetical protein